MLRRNLLLGWILAAFGMGLLFGFWIGGGFLAHCIGFAIVIAGFCTLCKK